MSGNDLRLMEGRVRSFDPATKIATVVLPGNYGMEPIEVPPFTRNVSFTDVASLYVGDRVLVTMNENEPPEWMLAHADTGPLASWPVGSIFISVMATSPAVLLGGGTWVAFGTGRMLIGRDVADATMDTAEETGGAKTVTLSANHLPPHNHDHGHVHPIPHQHDMDHDHPSFSAPVTLSAVVMDIDFAMRQGSTAGSTASAMAASATGTSVNINTNPTATFLSGSGTATVNVPLSSGFLSGSTSANTGAASPAATDNNVTTNTAVPNLPPYIVTYMWKRTA